MEPNSDDTPPPRGGFWREFPATDGRLILAVLVAAAVHVVLYLGLPWDWWFEDDPIQFAMALQRSSPLPFFLDQELLRHHGSGSALVPWMFTSFWVDMMLAPRSATFAYLHQCVSAIGTAVLLALTYGNCIFLPRRLPFSSRRARRHPRLFPFFRFSHRPIVFHAPK